MPEGTLYSSLKSEAPELAMAVDDVYRDALDIWAKPYLSEFTDHGEAHMRQVEGNLCSLTAYLQETDSRLRPNEIYILLAACYLHDIGMQSHSSEARSKHAEFSYELILNSAAKLGIEKRRVTLRIKDEDRVARAAIAKIAKAHWADFASELPREEFAGFNKKARMRLLGALLAMADLTDVSPCRAGYYRSMHRLYDPDALGSLHQTKHELVKGCEITIPDEQVRTQLQFHIDWGDDGPTTYEVSDWVLAELYLYWRKTEHVLFEESGGVIGWADPWIRLTFEPPVGPIPDLDVGALHMMRAQRQEQLRIDREAFAGRFRDALENDRAVCFLFPKGGNMDGKKLSDWCEAYSRIQENCVVARLVEEPSSAMDIASMVALIMKQWGQDLPPCADNEAVVRLKTFLAAEDTRSFVTIIAPGRCDRPRLGSLLETLFERPSGSGGPARICLLLTEGATGPTSLRMAGVDAHDGSVFPKAEVLGYLRDRLGYGPGESRRIYGLLDGMGYARKPGSIYTYIDSHWGSQLSSAHVV